MSFASRLKSQRERMGLTQIQLASLLGVTKGAIGNYETGHSSPKAEVLFKVFDVLQCDANYLFQDEMSSLHEETATPDEMADLVRKFRKLTPYGQEAVISVLNIELKRSQPASAGTGTYLGPDGFEEIMVEPEQIANADFGVPVSGDSMEPRFHDGDIILVSINQPVEVGDIALVTMDGCGYVKKIGEGELISLNNRYDPIPMTEDIRINGKVIGTLSPDT